MRNSDLLVLAVMFIGAAPLSAQPESATPTPQPRVMVLAPLPGDAPQTARGPVRVSGGVMASQIISRVNPEYPADARASGVEGSVVLHVLVGRDGAVESVVPISGPEVLRQAAVDAVKQWLYRPFLLNDEPVEVDTTVTINFNLNHSEPQPQS